MTFWNALGDATDSITSNALRSLLTMLGIIIGVGALITMLSIGAGAQARIAEQIASLGANVLMILPGAARGATGSDGNFIRKTRLTTDDARAVAEGALTSAGCRIGTGARANFDYRSFRSAARIF